MAPDVVLTHGRIFPLWAYIIKEDEAPDGVGNS